MSTLCPFPYEDNDWGEPADIWKEKKVRARKEHTCCECGGKILLGQVYGRVDALVAGEGWISYERCPACLILAELVATTTKECPLWGGLGESVEYANATMKGVRHNEETDEYEGLLPSPWEHRKQWEAA